MRMTNKIMQNNTLTNINNVKTLEDYYNTQLATGKKIVKPSDDPVIAIRALRLRTNVTETTQFYTKNVSDANSWMETTEDALTNVADLLTNIYEQTTKEVNSDNKASDLKVRIDQMREYADEIMKNGNADFAGRYIFSGYRTGSTLTFQDDTVKEYQIHEDMLGPDSFETVRFVNYSAVDGISKGAGADKNDVSYCDVNRIQLAYGDLDENYAGFNIKIATGSVPHTDLTTGITTYETKYTYLTTPPANATDVDEKSPGVPKEFEYDVTDAAGVTTKKTPEFEQVSKYQYFDKDGNVLADVDAYLAANPNEKVYTPYEYAAYNKDAVVLVAETGEVLFGENVYTALQAATEVNVDGTEWDEREIVIDYQKSQWDQGDTKPEHYFACESGGVAYNDVTEAKYQQICYDVGLSQAIRVNTNAAEVFDQGIVRTVEELEDALAQLEDLERYRNELEEKVKGDDSYQDQYDAVCKAYDLVKDKMKNMFSAGITKYQKYLDKANLATTNAGARSARLELVENRLSSQLDTVKELQSLNEDADETETAINLTTAKTTYEAALMAAGKLANTSLLNYI